MTHTALASTKKREETPSVQLPEMLLVSKKKAAEMLDFSSVNSMNSVIQRYKIPIIYIGTTPRIRIESLRKAVEQMEMESQERGKDDSNSRTT